MTAEQKEEKLIAHLKELGSVAVAFSSGVDSAYLLKIAKDTLGDSVVAITIRSQIFPEWEYDESVAFCKKYDIRQVSFGVDALSIEGFKDNPPERCYLCKKRLFEGLVKIARDMDIPHIVEGTNTDDLNDVRPGYRAIQELSIISPLLDAGLSKQDIRNLSKKHGLPTHDKPSYACLASRFAVREKISVKRLKMVEHAENLLREKGFKQIRVRLHKDLARIELDPKQLDLMLDEALRAEVYDSLHALGFRYVTLDLKGYQMGSMNAPSTDC